MMRRLARHLFTLCSVVSLLLCVAAGILWVRGYWYSDALRFRGSAPIGYVVLYSARGGTLLTVTSAFLNPNITLPFYTAEDDPEPAELTPSQFDRFRSAGFGLAVFPSPPFRIATRSIWVPQWFLVLVFAATPARWLHAERRRRRQRSDAQHPQCLACGYDLRASPKRCSECGTGAAAR